MKKRILAVTLGLALTAVAFTGCTTKAVTPPVDDNKPADVAVATEGKLTDGMYLVKGEVSENGDFSMTTLEVKDGQVSDFNYNGYLIASGEAKNDSNYPYAEGIAVVKDLNAQFNEKKDIEAVDFDAVTGATHTKDDFKAVVATILGKATKGETYTPVYKDGVYEAKATEEVYGWLAQVVVKVQDGQIVGVDYAELAVADADGVKAGDRKTADNYEYAASFEVANTIQKMIINNNGTENLNVDGVTGATNTRDLVMELVNGALSTAK